MASPAPATPGGSANGGGGGASSGGGGGNPNPNKPDPELAQGIDASLHTRQIPAPLPEGATGGMSSGARQAAEDEDKEDQCPVCLADLPDTGRGITPCGHVFCFACIHKWVQTSAKCPTCRVDFNRITKTLTPQEVAKENARTEVKKNQEKEQKRLNKKQQPAPTKTTRKKRNNSRLKAPVPQVMIKVIRLRDKTKQKQKPATPPQYTANYYPITPRQREESARQQAQGRLEEVAEEAQLEADKASEAFRRLRERATRSVQEMAAREAEEKARRAKEAEEEAKRAREAEEQARRAKEAAVEARRAKEEAKEAAERAKETMGANAAGPLEAAAPGSTGTAVAAGEEALDSAALSSPLAPTATPRSLALEAVLGQAEAGGVRNDEDEEDEPSREQGGRGRQGRVPERQVRPEAGQQARQRQQQQREADRARRLSQAAENKRDQQRDRQQQQQSQEQGRSGSGFDEEHPRAVWGQRVYRSMVQKQRQQHQQREQEQLQRATQRQPVLPVR